ncbi:cysteine desulfurase family protein [Caviibacter abscessus]|uniref:cysteine desulfurase family protein n=1 Tax=Caviibacter abscessus TaxID=1766719 RepID=UPI000837EDA2|nr:cysteine desulfurase family protein [Caviibacter abscessus]
MRNIYFDNAASTKMRQEVIDFLCESYNNVYANPSAVHTYGRNARALLENARKNIASKLNIKPSDLIFTSGATESNNLAIRGILLKSEKKEIICSSIEHSSILTLCDELSKEGYKVKYINIKPNGEIDIEHLKTLISDDTALITVMAVNNETGVKQPLDKISDLIKGKNIYFHSDAVQLISKEYFNPYELGLDSFSASPHKFYGPKGIGLLYIKDDIEISKLMYGGSQERNKRAGTENINSILATSLALDLSVQNMEKDNKYLQDLMDYFISEVSKLNYIKINGENRVNSIISIQIENQDIQLLLPMLDMRGIYVSGGSACMSGSLKASQTLINMGLSEKQALSSVRISLSIYNTKEEIKYLIDTLKNICEGE